MLMLFYRIMYVAFFCNIAENYITNTEHFRTKHCCFLHSSSV